jgi:DtxR family Mn-dependent transcriptional regulator
MRASVKESSPGTLSRSRQDYLKALYTLGGGERVVQTQQLARQLGVRPPSATLMLRQLARVKLVVLDPGVGARLSAEGERQALQLVRRHRILETFLVQVLGLDWAECHEDAEVLEHHVSDRVLEAIDRMIGHPVYDPHGHPIPDRRGRIRRRDLTPLAELRTGSSAVVREIRDADGRRLTHWKRVGLVPGAAVRVRDVKPLEDVYELEVGGRHLVTGSEGLDGVLVEVRPSGAHRGRPS